jgi:hypothetical protein
MVAVAVGVVNMDNVLKFANRNPITINKPEITSPNKNRLRYFFQRLVIHSIKPMNVISVAADKANVPAGFVLPRCRRTFRLLLRKSSFQPDRFRVVNLEKSSQKTAAPAFSSA